MRRISNLPRHNRLLLWLKQLPISLQLILVFILIYLTWHFRYVSAGVDPSKLQKVEGVLYSFECITHFSGSDAIILKTSLQEEVIHFSGWQKCKNIKEQLMLSNKKHQAVFYIERNPGVFSDTLEGTIWVYAVDLISPNESKILPYHGLGVEYVANVYCLIFFFIALYFSENIRGKWIERQGGSKKKM